MKIKIKTKTGIEGCYEKIEILNNEGVAKQTFDGFSNLITDIGLARLWSNIDSDIAAFSHCRVGSGSTTPQFTDQSLASQMASTNSSTYTQNTSIPGGYCETVVTYTFALGAVVGNVTEIATGWESAGNSVFSRTLVKDSGGSPVSIAVQSDEILRITWRHRRYWSVDDSSGTLANSGNKGGSYGWVCRPSEVGVWRAGTPSNARMALSLGGNNSFSMFAFYSTPSVIGDVTGKPSGSGTTATGVAQAQTKSTESTVRYTLGTSIGNAAGGISCFIFGNSGGASAGIQYQVQFSPAIVKTSSDILQIDLSHEWSRV